MKENWGNFKGGGFACHKAFFFTKKHLLVYFPSGKVKKEKSAITAGEGGDVMPNGKCLKFFPCFFIIP